MGEESRRDDVWLAEASAAAGFEGRYVTILALSAIGFAIAFRAEQQRKLR
jgi:hypothetical protein